MGNQRRRLTNEEKNEIIEMRLNGHSDGDIAKCFGVSRKTVSRVCLANGVSSPYFKGGRVSRTLDIANIPKTERIAVSEKKETKPACAVINRALSVVGLNTEYQYILNAKNKTVIVKNNSGEISIHLSEIFGMIDELYGIEEKLENFNVGVELV